MFNKHQMRKWQGKRVSHVDSPQTLGRVMEVDAHEHALRVVWDDDSVDWHTPQQLRLEE